MKNISTLSLALLILCQISSFAHTCIHDELDHSFDEGMHSESHSIRGRVLAEWEPIRIKADYSLLSNLSETSRDFIQYVAFPAAIERIQNTYSVIRYTKPLMAPANKTECHGKPIPTELLTTGSPDTDLYIIVTWKADPKADWVASAIYCGLDATTSRPYLGTIAFNTHFLNSSELRWKTTLSVTLHELHHVLFFSSSLFQRWIDPTTMKRKNDTNGYMIIDGLPSLVFIDPLIVRAAREYFNCSTIKYVRLENQGGAGNKGSHWERKWFGNEFITAETSGRMVLSHMTLVVAEATGWYKPNYNTAEKLYWGKNRGCDFLKDKCVFGSGSTDATGPEFCTIPDEGGCDFESSFPSICFTRKGTVPNPNYWDYYGTNITSGDPFTDNCAVYARLGSKVCGPGGWSSGHSPEYFGTNSACFKSSITYQNKSAPTQGYCYEYKCAKTGDLDKYILLVSVKDQIFECKYLGEAIHTHVSGLKGKLICPDPQSFCAIKVNTCDNACGGVGECIDGTCLCPSDRLGPDCLRYTTVENDPNCSCSFPAVNSYNGNCVCPEFNCSTNPVPSASDCSACIPNCTACINVTVCSSCQDGFEVSNGACVSTSSSSQSNSSNNTASTNNSETTESLESSENNNSNLTNSTNSSSLQPVPDSPIDDPDASNEIVAAPVAPVDALAKVLVCQSAQFYDKVSNVCVNCTAGCSNCTSATACTVCTTGLLLYFNKCLSCPSTCSQCTMSNSSDPNSQISCTKCITGEYFLKKEGGAILCASKSEQLMFLSAIIATIALSLSIYFIWYKKTQQKPQITRVSV